VLMTGSDDVDGFGLVYADVWPAKSAPRPNRKPRNLL
jgi:hypothetical protein